MGVWPPQNLLVLQLWHFVGFSSDWQESGLFRTHWDFSFGTLWGSVQGVGNLATKDPLGLWLWDIVGFSLSWWESGLLGTHWIFSFDTFWGSIQGDGSLAPQDPLRLWLWDIVGFSSVWHEPGFLRTCREVVPLKEKVRKIGKKLSVYGCYWVSIFRGPRTVRAWCGKLWVFSQFLSVVKNGVQCCSLLRGVHFSQHGLLRGLSFPGCMLLAPFL